MNYLTYLKCLKMEGVKFYGFVLLELGSHNVMQEASPACTMSCDQQPSWIHLTSRRTNLQNFHVTFPIFFKKRIASLISRQNNREKPEPRVSEGGNGIISRVDHMTRHGRKLKQSPPSQPSGPIPFPVLTHFHQLSRLFFSHVL